MESALKVLLKWLGRFKVLSPRVLTISVFLTTLLFIYKPAITGNVSIEVPPSRIALEVENGITNLTLRFVDPVHVESYSVSPIGDWGETKPYSVRLDREMVSISITNLITDKKSLMARFNIDFAGSSPARIASAKENNVLVKLSTFERLVKGDKRYQRVSYIRDYIADWANKFNDPISNLIMSAMAFALVPLVGWVIRLNFLYYFLSDGSLQKRLQADIQKADMDITAFKEVEDEKFLSRRRFVVFLQGLGPALGFLLTVTSLISGLNPKVDLANDISAFFGSLHIAMVSTALGLAIRIFAVWVERLDLELTLRLERLLIAQSSEQEGHEQHVQVIA